jgi:putative redox protein
MVRVLHHRDGPQGKDRFAREIVLEGALDADQRRRLLEIANRCPVHRTLEQGSEIVTVLAQEPLPGDLDPAPTDHMDHMIAVCRD